MTARLFIKILLLLYITAAASLLLYGEVKDPDIPGIPSIITDIERSEETLKAGLTIYGNDKVRGEIILPSGTEIKPPGSNGKVFTVKDISRITVKKWERSGSAPAWKFIPASYEILLRDRTMAIHNGRLPFLDRFRMKVSGNVRTFYCYYIDYFKKDKWTNTGNSGFDTPASVPAAGTVYVIDFTE